MSDDSPSSIGVILRSAALEMGSQKYRSPGLSNSLTIAPSTVYSSTLWLLTRILRPAASIHPKTSGKV